MKSIRNCSGGQDGARLMLPSALTGPKGKENAVVLLLFQRQKVITNIAECLWEVRVKATVILP